MNTGSVAILVVRPNYRCLFSLSPIGGVGRGEGANRAADRGRLEVRPPSDRNESVALSPTSARPLTLTLSPNGGEGTCHSTPLVLEAAVGTACSAFRIPRSAFP